MARRAVGRSALRKRRRLAGKLLDAYVAAPAAWRRDLAVLSGKPRMPIVVGPWTNEVGYELLYWIPLLRHAFGHRGIDPDRVIAVSRGGVASWYAQIASHYVDVFDLWDPERFVRANRQRELDQGGQRQLFVFKEDQQIIRDVGVMLDLDRFHVLHPASMYRFITGYLRGLRPPKDILKESDYSPLPGRYPRPASLPFDGDYLVAKFYASPPFPRTAENQALVDETLARLARRMPVVVLNTGLELDDHGEFDVAAAPDLHDARALVQPRDNLEVQTALVANARGFIGTYGGFSYLAPLLGVRSIGVFSRPEFVPVHLATASVVLNQDALGGFAAVHTRALGLAVDEFGVG